MDVLAAAAISEEQKEQFFDWLDKRIGRAMNPCSACGHRHFGVFDHFVHVPLFIPNVISGGMDQYPHVGVFCGNCGNTRFFNAVLCGLFPSAAAFQNNESPNAKNGVTDGE